MPIRRTPSYINWELLRHEAGLILHRQPGWLAIGLGGPLVITGYTLLRPWTPQHGVRDLLQAALFLCDWNILFALVYACIAWLRPGQEKSERELLHLPLSTTHFTLRRSMHSGSVPLAAAVLSLAVWLVLLCYYRLPYGVGGDLQRWMWMSGDEQANPWRPRVLWLALAILSSALLSAAFVAWLEELVPARYVRCVLLLGIPVGLYFAVRLASGSYDPTYGYSYGPFLMNYRQTRGVGPWPYAVLLALCIGGPVLIGWLRPFGRWLLLALPVLLFGGLMLWRLLPVEVRVPLSPLTSAMLGRDTRYAAALFIGHLSPPRNARLLLDSYPSNVLFSSGTPLIEPNWPQSPELLPEPLAGEYRNPAEFIAAHAEYERQAEAADARYQQDQRNYETEYARYEASYAAAPRLALWVGAGLYPLLLPLWAFIGLCLGIAARREPARDG
jgi:hypothetical protein